jgi:hypothetical protein
MEFRSSLLPCSRKFYCGSDPSKTAVTRRHHPFIYRPHLMLHTVQDARYEWERQSRACQTFDPYRSFVPGEPGYERRRLWCDQDGPCVDIEAWRLGKKAYDILTDRMGKQPTNEELRQILNECQKLADEVHETLRHVLAEGVILLRHPPPDGVDVAPEEAAKMIDGASLLWRLSILHQLGRIMSEHGVDDGTDWEAVAAIQCLVCLDSVVSAVFCDGRGVIEAFATARELFDAVELDTTTRAEGARLAQERKEQDARNAAAKRHQPTRAVRNLAEELYAQGKAQGEWPSRRQAAKKLLPTLQEKARAVGFRPSAERFEQTVYDWLTRFDQK